MQDAMSPITEHFVDGRSRSLNLCGPVSGGRG